MSFQPIDAHWCYRGLTKRLSHHLWWHRRWKMGLSEHFQEKPQSLVIHDVFYHNCHKLGYPAFLFNQFRLPEFVGWLYSPSLCYSPWYSSWYSHYLSTVSVIFPIISVRFQLYSNDLPMIFSVYPVYSPLYQLYPIRLPFDLWYSYYLLITWLVWQPIFTLLGPGRRYLVSLSDEILDRASWSWLEGPNHPAMAVSGWESPYGL